MALLPLGLVILSAFLHAAWNALLKQHRQAEAAARSIMVGSCLLALATALALPLGPWFPHPKALAWTALAGAFEGAYFIALARALSGAPLGAAYAVMRGGATLFVWPLSVALLGERVTGLGAGSALIMGVGILLLGSSDLRRTHGAGLAWSFLGAGCIAGYHLAYKQALALGALPLPLFAASVGTASLLRLGLDAIRPPQPGPRFAWGGTVPLAIVTCTASFGLFLWALRLGGAGLTLSLRNTSLIFAQLLALGLGERPGPRQWVALGLLSAGAVGLGLGR
ncbi:MAG: EamA family transporter [Acidobacteria bacterium]|nr:EamA family transporter [Acidobacteriota bacterium]